MSVFKKMLLVPSVLTLPVLATAVTSCATVPQIDDNLASQIEGLTSDAAKEVYSNYWSRDAYAELYLKSKTPTADVTSEEFEKNKEIIKTYLLTLNPIPESTLINGVNGTKVSDEISKQLFSAYTFYTAWKTSANINYFREQKQIWVENQLSLNDQSIEKDFNPKFAYSSSSTELAQFKLDFHLLYKIMQTGIQTELLNMAVAEFYFTASTSDMIQRGTNYNDLMDGDINGIDYWNATSFDINSPTYFLEKYLVEKAPKVKWNYTSEKADKVANLTNTKIKNTQDYHNLWSGEQVGTASSPKKIFSKDLLIASPDATFNASAAGFYGYNTTIELSTASGEGDLSTDPDVIRAFGSNSSGLLNSSNQFVSYDTLLSRAKIDQLDGTVAYLPPITIRNTTDIIRKNSKQITLSDLTIDTEGKLDVDGAYTTGENTWKVLSITPILNNSNSKQTIKLEMTYSNSNAVNGFANYPYNVVISWKQTNNPADSEIVTELPKQMFFNQLDTNNSFQNQQIFGIDPIVEGKVNVSYYIRLLPEFKWNDIDGIKEVREINGKEKAIGTFSMDGTPWSSTPENKLNQRMLAFSLYMNDPELIKEIKSFLVLNDVAISPGKISQVNAILEELGIIYLPNKPDYATPRATLNGQWIK